MRKDFSQIHTLMSDDEYNAMMAFSRVKNRVDFEKWENEMGRYLPSQAVRDGIPATLPEDF
jgi:hypothetical protein